MRWLLGPKADERGDRSSRGLGEARRLSYYDGVARTTECGMTIEGIILFLLPNFTLTFLAGLIVFSAVTLARASNALAGPTMAEELLRIRPLT
jgi:hypothetical protein